MAESTHDPRSDELPDDPYQRLLRRRAIEFAEQYGPLTPQQEDRLAILLWPRAQDK